MDTEQKRPRIEDVALLREVDVIGDRKRGISAIFPVSRSEWRSGVRKGIYPQPVKMPGKNLTFWRRADVMALVARIAGGAA
jgi:prophage regulatory protein